MNVSSPFGLKPVSHPSGCVRQSVGTLASGLASDIFQFQPIARLTDGNLSPAAAGARAIGVFIGIEYTDSEGKRHLTNRWVASTVATEIVVYYTEDPDIVYEVQANATLSQAAIGDQYDWSAPGGSALTGISNQSLNVASAAGAGASAGLRVVGLRQDPANAWGDSFPVVRVTFSEHQYVADRVAI